MIIEAVSLSLPLWKVENDEVLDLIKFHSKPIFSGNLEKTLRKIRILLEKTGAETRYWLDKSKNEKPIDHIVQAVDQALTRAKLDKDDIDLLIYVGIGRGFIEPGNSYLVAQSLNMKKARCFDLIDACMSWTATMQIVDSLFKVKAYKTAMIINAEFTVQRGPAFKNYSLRSEEQLSYTFPSFTIGEGATCTILMPNDPANFQFHFSSRADLADLCVIPTPDYQDYCTVTEKIAPLGAMYFSSYGSDLHQQGQHEAIKLFKKVLIERENIDMIFTHASSKTEWHNYGETLGVADKIFHIYPETGNLVSASVPAAMALALEKTKLAKGQKVVFWVGSAGMSFSVCNFTF